MPFVVVAPFLHLMIPVLVKRDDIFFIKRKGPKGYFYYKGKLPLVSLLNLVKKIIRTELPPVYVYDVFGMYNGMTDVTPYLSVEMKNSKGYYNQKLKELTHEEIAEFVEKNHIYD